MLVDTTRACLYLEPYPAFSGSLQPGTRQARCCSPRGEPGCAAEASCSRLPGRLQEPLSALALRALWVWALCSNPLAAESVIAGLQNDRTAHGTSEGGGERQVLGEGGGTLLIQRHRLMQLGSSCRIESDPPSAPCTAAWRMVLWPQNECCGRARESQNWKEASWSGRWCTPAWNGYRLRSGPGEPLQPPKRLLHALDAND